MKAMTDMKTMTDDELHSSGFFMFAQKWVVDPIPDANGNWTVRIADGSPNGNTEENPVATFYDEKSAGWVVAQHNVFIDRLGAFPRR